MTKHPRAQPLPAGAVAASALPGTSAPDVPTPSASVTPSTSETPAQPAPEDSAATPGNAATAPVSSTTTVTAVRSGLAATTAESWTAQTAGPVRDVRGHDVALNECASVHDAATWQQQPYLSGAGNPAVLELYIFGTEAAADTAYEQVTSGMSSCQATSRALQSAKHVNTDAAAQQTATAPKAAAFERSWTGVEGLSAAGTQTNHLYLAAAGTSVLVLHFDELGGGSSAAPYDVHQDPNVLSLLTNLLAGPAGTH
ncbi:hypothetical protein [Kitasatospora viridis]|uniref:hypothetical protein n=1 Tax=Kitasatospora viridis TaxID=281105 RepID=UPI0011A09F5F|nr:hypothetical protein [Kitasatospora viridis]